jgi:hypothetical protein
VTTTTTSSPNMTTPFKRSFSSPVDCPTIARACSFLD